MNITISKYFPSVGAQYELLRGVVGVQYLLRDLGAVAPGVHRFFLDVAVRLGLGHAAQLDEAALGAAHQPHLLIEAYMQEIICGVYRIFSRKFYKNYLLSGSNNSDEKLVYDVINYIDVHLESMENLSALSAEFGYSYTHIAQKFSAFTGESLKSYHTKRRFEKSNEYLRQGYSVTKVAELMGFKSIHAFSRAYKKYVGMAPREYKKWAEEDKKNLPQPAENS